MDIFNFPSKARKKIYEQFPPMDAREVPHIYEIKEIEYENLKIQEYEVIFWHRLLKTIYQEPPEIECKLIGNNQEETKIPLTVSLQRSDEDSQWIILNTSEDAALKIQSGIQSGEIRPFPVNWKYFIRLSDTGIMEIGTKSRNTEIYFAHVCTGQIKEEDCVQAERYILLLLDEAKKSKNRLFNPLKEFEKSDSLKYYHIFNVYLANYFSAKFMFSEALTEEKGLHDRFVGEGGESGLYDDEERNQIEQFMFASGMYFLSAITYFFMSLEGFINIVFHSFLKKNIRDSNLNIEQRLDIEQKLILLPSLCDGFLQGFVDFNTDLYKKFIKFKKYRNSIFHSKVEDSLKDLGFFENGFLYVCEVDQYKQDIFPTQKIKLSANDVMEAKEIVDSIIAMVIDSMEDQPRNLTEKFILKSTHIPYFIKEDGSLSFGGYDIPKGRKLK